MRPQRTASFGLALALTFALAGRARADAPADDDALTLYRQSEESYKAGRFQAAADLLRRAYDVRPEPAFLFNMGRAYERLGDLPHAIDAYGRYLEADPAAKNRADVGRTIATLRRQLGEIEALEERHRAETQALRSAQARQRAHSEEEVRGARLVLPKVLTGVGAAALVAGGVFVVLALNRQSAALHDGDQVTAAHDLDGARRFSTVSTAAFIGGGALAATGLVWWWIASRPTHPPATRQGNAAVRPFGAGIAF